MFELCDHQVLQKKYIMDNPIYYEFRETDGNETELKALLRLRYEIYAKSSLATFCPVNDYQIDLDEYDAYARHFGLFKYNCSGEESVIGYMRVIEQCMTRTSDTIYALARSLDRDLYKRINISPKCPFPVMKYYPYAHKRITELLIQNPATKYCESSRFSIAKEERSFKLARFCTDCAISIYFEVKNFNVSIICCANSHEPFYRRYGYQQLLGPSPIQEDISKSTSYLLSVCRDSYSKKEKFLRMKEAYLAKGRISLHPAFPKEYSFSSPIADSEELFA